MFAWSEEECEAIVDALLRERIRRAWGTGRFPQSVWDEVEANISRFSKAGVHRTITERFGWDDKLGADVGENNRHWEEFLRECKLMSESKYRVACRFRNRGWKLLKKMTRLLEGPLKFLLQIVRRPEHEIYRRYLTSQKSSTPSERMLHKFKFKKEEQDEDMSLFTPPPDDDNDISRAYETPEDDSQDSPEPFSKRARSDSENVLLLPPAKRRRSSPVLHDPPNVTVDGPGPSNNPVAVDTDFSVRKSRIEAIKRVQALETDLSDRCIVALIDIFETKVEAADVYLSLTRESVRKQWVNNRIGHIREQEREDLAP
ncbi:hypothetical protein CPB84DRAFT_1752048 [Gymnopilus junonius]|uniref:Myb/SANT-like domain-containing protein n=1 Tax=Gymnopilus junonius TaxID=109634 RepID=A0A9P5THD5_GYMJU|nr:hypothetical protein CPB84DRAFT_1752048 [Gymnopilus junonius]